MAYFLGRGDVYIGDYVGGGVIPAMTKFHCPSFEVSTEATYAEHKNSSSKMLVRDARVATEQMGKLKMTLDEFSAEILAMALSGEVASDDGTSFSANAFPTVSLTKPILPVPGGYTDLASLTITDSEGTPATLTLNTHYSVDLKSGLVTFLNLGSYTQPFKAAGTTNAKTNKQVSIGTKSSVEKCIRFVGVNLHDNSNAIVDIWRVHIPPVNFPVKTDGSEFNKFEFSPEMLSDTSAPFYSTLGGYGHIDTFA